MDRPRTVDDGPAVDPAGQQKADESAQRPGPLADGEPPGSRRFRERACAALLARLAAISGPGWSVVIAVALSATAAVLINQHLFPHLSVNNDEALYRLQAQTLAGGDLFVAAPREAESYAPWLAAVVDGHYVLKYTPVIASLLALSLVFTGGTSAALAFVAAAAVTATYHLGLELFRDRRVAAVAAWLLALSPLVVLHSAMLLAYLPVLVLFACVFLGLLRGLRTHRRMPLVGAGLAIGLAAAARPYDTLLMISPILLWMAWRGARGRRRWLSQWVALGLVFPVAGLLGYNWAATGNPLQLPFALLEPDDRLGFGIRRLFPTDIPHRFGIGEGLTAIGDHLWLLGGWACGGVLLAGLSVASLIRRRLPEPALAVGMGALLVTGGYVFFWGAWNAAELWGGIRYVGPFYLMPTLIALVLLGARGLVDIATVRPPIAGLIGAAALGLSAVVLVPAVQANLEFTRRDGDVVRMVTGQPGPLLVMVSVDPPFLMHPTSAASNSPTMDDRVLFAVSRGDPDFNVLADHPDRSAYLLRLALGYNRALSSPSAARLERLRTVDGSSVEVRVSAAVPRNALTARLEMTVDGHRRSFEVHPEGPSDGSLIVGAGGVDVTGFSSDPQVGDAPAAGDLPAAGDRSVELALFYTPSSGGLELLVDQQLLPVRVHPDTGTVSVLAPGETVGAVGSGITPAIHLEVR